MQLTLTEGNTRWEEKKPITISLTPNPTFTFGITSIPKHCNYTDSDSVAYFQIMWKTKLEQPTIEWVWVHDIFEPAWDITKPVKSKESRLLFKFSSPKYGKPKYFTEVRNVMQHPNPVYVVVTYWDSLTRKSYKYRDNFRNNKNNRKVPDNLRSRKSMFSYLVITYSTLLVLLTGLIWYCYCCVKYLLI